MRIGFACFFLPGRISGPSSSVLGLARALEEEFGCECRIYSSHSGGPSFYLNSREVRSAAALYDEMAGLDLLVVAGSFDIGIWKFCKAASKAHVPYVLSARGNLMREALKKSSVKKAIAMGTYTRQILNGAAAVHFLSEEERDNSVPLRPTSFIARNGVDFSSCGDLGGNRKRKLIFLGRLDVFHKGLDLVVSAIGHAGISLRELGWTVELRGPSVSQGAQYLEDRVRRLKIGDIVTIGGALTGTDRTAFLTEGQIFLHTSRYEGQPQAVLEAMRCGLVPIVTPGTNLTQVIHASQAGWVAGFDVLEVADVLGKAVRHSELDVMGKRGAEYVRESFSWAKGGHEFWVGIQALQ